MQWCISWLVVAACILAGNFDSALRLTEHCTNVSRMANVVQTCIISISPHRLAAAQGALILLVVEPTVIKSMRIFSNSAQICGLIQMHIVISQAMICR